MRGGRRSSPASSMPSVKAANFNHWFLLEVHRARRQDVLHYLGARPWGYVQNVIAGLRDLFRPSTEWHPRTGTDRSPTPASAGARRLRKRV